MQAAWARIRRRYITDSGAGRAQLLANPNLEYFQNQGIEVLLLSDPVDVFVIPPFTSMTPNR